MFYIECAKLIKNVLFSQMKIEIMKILVLTEHDDCCGPMAAAFLSDYSEKLKVVSAGRQPGAVFSPMLVEAMMECLIDMSGYVPVDVASLDLSSFDAVYECHDKPCPETLEACRELRDFIKNESFLFYRDHCVALRH